MQITTFNVPHGDLVAQDELNAFLRGRRVLQVNKAFAGNGWSFCVEWLDGKPSDGAAKWRERIDYRDKLDPETFQRFAQLRERRKAIATEDGIPPYMIMTDAQMAEAAKAVVLTEDVLKGIEGFGAARLQKYGARLLAETGTQLEKENENELQVQV